MSHPLLSRIALLLALAAGAATLLDRPRASPPPWADPNSRDLPVRVTEESVYRLEWTLLYRNPGPGPTSPVVSVPLPRDQARTPSPGAGGEPDQRVEILACTPSPRQIGPDPWGNTIATFALPEVPPGGAARIAVEARVRRRGFFVDAEAGGASGGTSSAAALRASEAGAEGEDPQVSAAARRVVAGEPDPYYRTLRIYDFLRGLRYELEGRARTDREALATGTVQCSDAARLLVGMARSLGLPARYCAGFYLRPEEPVTRTTHAWAEVYLEPVGWLPLDPTLGRQPADRLSRFGRLESRYVLLWEGRGCPGVVATGLGAGDLELQLGHSLESQARPEQPALDPLPALTAGGTRGGPPPKGGLPGEVQGGLEALSQGRYSDAEARLRAAGEGLEVDRARARLYLETRQASRALEALRRISRSGGALEVAGPVALLCQDLGDEAALAELCARALELLPGELPFQLGLAQARFRLGQRREAERLLSELSSAGACGGLPEALLGRLHLERGDLPRAAGHLRRGLGRGLDEAEQRYALHVLERLRALEEGRERPGDRSLP